MPVRLTLVVVLAVIGADWMLSTCGGRQSSVLSRQMGVAVSRMGW